MMIILNGISEKNKEYELNKTTIVTEIYNNNYFNRLFICKRDKSYNEDLRHEVYEYLLKMDDQRLINLYNRNELLPYINQTIKNIQSKTGQFHQKYFKGGHYYTDEIYSEDKVEELDVNEWDHIRLGEFILSKNILSWLENELFKYYYNIETTFLDDICKKRSYREIAKALGISSVTVNKIVDSIRVKIFNELNDTFKLDDEYLKKILSRK